MAETHVDQQLLEFIIKSVVSNPDAVKVERTVDEMGVLLSLKVDPNDMAQVIGRQGSMAKALRTILKVAGAKNKARVNLKIEEPEGSSRVRREERTDPSKEADKAADDIDDVLKF
jgi:hypothetical protein